MEAANRWLAEDFLPRFNARFAVRAAEPGSAFMAYVGWPLEDILYIQEEPKERLDARLYPCYPTEGKRHAGWDNVKIVSSTCNTTAQFGK